MSGLMVCPECPECDHRNHYFRFDTDEDVGVLRCDNCDAEIRYGDAITSMPEKATEIGKLDWKQIGIGAALRAAFLVIAVLVMALGMTYAGRTLGWPDSMIRIGANVGIAAVTLPFLVQAASAAIRQDVREFVGGEE